MASFSSFLCGKNSLWSSSSSSSDSRPRPELARRDLVKNSKLPQLSPPFQSEIPPSPGEALRQDSAAVTPWGKFNRVLRSSLFSSISLSSVGSLKNPEIFWILIYIGFFLIMFISLHQPMTKNQIRNTKCRRTFFAIVTIFKERKPGCLCSFWIVTDIWCLVFGF